MRSEVSAEPERPTMDTLSWTAGQTTGNSGNRLRVVHSNVAEKITQTKRIASENVACWANQYE